MTDLVMEKMMKDHDDMMNVPFKEKVGNVFRKGKKAVHDNKESIKSAAETVKDTAETVVKSEPAKEFGNAVKSTLLDAIRSNEFKTMATWTLLMAVILGLLMGLWHIGAIIGAAIGLKKLILG